jgi:Tfp pilus tip-associated adhesin PilY1
VPDDNKTTEQNTFYGLIEPYDESAGDYTWGEIDKTTLADVSNVDVTTDGDLTPAVNGIDNFPDFRKDMLQNGTGWKYDFESTGSDPTNRNSASALSYGKFLFFTRYLPPPLEVQSANECRAYLGESYLNAVDLVTGTAFYEQSFDGILGNENGVLTRETFIGDGYAYQSYVFSGIDYRTGKRDIIIKSPLSTGVIKDTRLTLPPSKSGRTSWREIEIQ